MGTKINKKLKGPHPPLFEKTKDDQLVFCTFLFGFKCFKPVCWKVTQTKHAMPFSSPSPCFENEFSIENKIKIGKIIDTEYIDN